MAMSLSDVTQMLRSFHKDSANSIKQMLESFSKDPANSVPGRCMYYFLKYAVFYGPVHFMASPIVINEKNLRQSGSLLVVSAHHSYWDYVYLALRARRLRAILKMELYNLSPKFFALGGAISINRKNKHGGSALMQMKTALRKGEAVLIFPQGTRNTDPENQDKIPSVKEGVGNLIKFADHVVFVGLAGTEGDWPLWRAPVIYVSKVYPKEKIQSCLPVFGKLDEVVRKLLEDEQRQAWEKYKGEHQPQSAWP